MFNMLRRVRGLIQDYIKEERGMATMHNLEVNAVFDEDLIEFLKSIEIYDEVMEGKMLCSCCSRKITLDNIGSIYPEKNEIKFCCNSYECYQKLIEKGV